ncbi:MAG: hypothetical protein ACLRSW_02415 [Christensenellaceae bacterium]
MPTNRWQLFWDIFKGNWKNLQSQSLILIFFLPIIAIFIFRVFFDQSNGMTLSVQRQSCRRLSRDSQYGRAFRIPLITSDLDVRRDRRRLVYRRNRACGRMYVIRNMVWTEGIFVANDFWRGVKLNFWNALQAALFFRSYAVV